MCWLNLNGKLLSISALMLTALWILIEKKHELWTEKRFDWKLELTELLFSQKEMIIKRDTAQTN